MSARVLIAGIGNVFLGDDGFGVEVANRLRREPLPADVEVSDFGIRALHLAFALLEPPPLLIVLDAVGRGDPPGTLSLIEPSPDQQAGGGVADGHGMSLPAVFAAVRDLGGALPRTLLVGCEPAFIGERWGLSPAVEEAVPRAVRMALELARPHLEGEETTQ